MIPVIVVHGGAGDVNEERATNKLIGVQNAARNGWNILKNGGSALDAVEAAVKLMEDDESFNAGKGSVLNINGIVENDALIMDGTTLKAGAVAAMKNIKNPVSIARLVMERTEHVLLAGEGAEKFAEQEGISKIPSDTLVIDYEIKCLEDFKNKTKGQPPGVGTVGAIAIDCNGHTATALSTGGTCGKMSGRVGDTPLVGCGGYSDDTVGATASTGHGESITRSCLAAYVFFLMEQGIDVQEAADRGTKRLTTKTGGTAGIIALTKDGKIGISHTTDKMAWASASGEELRAGITQSNAISEHL